MEMNMGGAAKRVIWSGIVEAEKKSRAREDRKKVLQAELEKIEIDRKADRSLLGIAWDEYEAKKAGGQTLPGNRGTMPDWEDLEFQVLSDTELRYRRKVKGIWLRVTMSELQLNDGRKGDMSTKLWATLCAFAHYDGKISTSSRRVPASVARNLAKKVQRLAEKLRRYFQLKGSPFKPYSKKNGYELRFKITDRPDSGRQAERNATHPGLRELQRDAVDRDVIGGDGLRVEEALAEDDDDDLP